MPANEARSKGRARSFVRGGRGGGRGGQDVDAARWLLSVVEAIELFPGPCQ